MCLKIEKTPFYPMVLLIIKGRLTQHFQTNPILQSSHLPTAQKSTRPRPAFQRNPAPPTCPVPWPMRLGTHRLPGGPAAKRRRKRVENVGKTWGKRGENVGKTWEKGGKRWGKGGKRWGNPWEIYEKWMRNGWNIYRRPIDTGKKSSTSMDTYVFSATESGAFPEKFNPKSRPEKVG